MKGYGVAADVWSLGVVLLEMAARRLPFENAVSQIELHDRLEARSKTAAYRCFVSDARGRCFGLRWCPRGPPCLFTCGGATRGSGRMAASRNTSGCSRRVAAAFDGVITESHRMFPGLPATENYRRRVAPTLHASLGILSPSSVSFISLLCSSPPYARNPHSKSERSTISSGSCPDTRRSSRKCSGDACRPIPKTA